MVQAQTVQAPDRAARLRALDVFVGDWHAEGTSFAHDPDTTDARANPVRWRSDEHYEWLAGGAFLLHRWQADVGGQAFIGTELIGYDEAEGGYFSAMFDNAGNHPRYRLEVRDRRWIVDGDATRATIEFGGRDRMAFHWEFKNRDGRWLPLCDRVAVRR
jgi:hypothetical protein